MRFENQPAMPLQQAAEIQQITAKNSGQRSLLFRCLPWKKPAFPRLGNPCRRIFPALSARTGARSLSLPSKQAMKKILPSAQIVVPAKAGTRSLPLA
jgi:hypothetical protein